MARSLIVSYDLRGSDENSSSYADLIDAIKAYGYYAKLMLSTWIVVTSETPETVCRNLWAHMDANDRLFVAPLPKGAHWHNIMARKDWMDGRPGA